ncbi:uncharacterized protein Hap1MRO34_025038 isoform 1-T1 [Clarias gariepinus]
MCNVKGGEYRDFRLTVEEATKRPLPPPREIKTISKQETTTTKPTLVGDDKTHPHSETFGRESLPFVPFAVVTAIFLHIIVAVVYCSTRKKGPDRVYYSRNNGDETVSLQ